MLDGRGTNALDASRLEDARVAFEKMLRKGNHLGLFAEQVDPAGATPVTAI